MTGGYLVVPSDINVLENKCKVGRKPLHMFEWVGLMCTLPMLHLRYSKLDRKDIRACLTKQYDITSQDPAVQLCLTRQRAVSRQVCAQPYMWGGVGFFGGMTYWSLRRYNYQARGIVIPFLAYAGSYVGRFVGDMMTQRHTEGVRDRALASLPAKVYYKSPAPAEE